MKYVEAPEEHEPGGAPAVFLAGGIQQCADWQAEAASALYDMDVVVLNPRCSNFPVDDPDAEGRQVDWECRHLNAADVVLFWFPDSPSHQPIALYELGKAAAWEKPLVVGADPAYLRRTNMRHQLLYARPKLVVHDELHDTLAAARTALRHVEPPPHVRVWDHFMRPLPP